jgi:Ser/Thr protein kinase RdoA (MazF antagonist)
MNETPYQDLSPDRALDALEAAGWPPDGRLLALNSYENRVYQMGVDGGQPVVVKFYRPQRWSDAQILEEHAFTRELADHDLSCVAPLANSAGETLFFEAGHRLAVFPRQGGHPPEVDIEANLVILGRALGRIHAVGCARSFEHRLGLDARRFGHDSREFLMASNFVPAEMVDAYTSTTEHLLARIDQLTIPARGRIHGDSHLGNLLWRDDVPHFVDFDDAVNGPEVQDLWMLLSGERDERTRQLSKLLEGYETFHHFDYAQLGLIEGLRTLRLMYHAAWIGRRWHDPAFPRAFPWYDSIKYWSDHVLDLREQLALLDEPPLAP